MDTGFESIKGVGPSTRKKLFEAKIRTIEELASASLADVTQAGIGEDKAKKLISEAKKILSQTSKASETAQTVQVTHEMKPAVRIQQEASEFPVRAFIAGIVVVLVLIAIVFVVVSQNNQGSLDNAAAVVNGQVITFNTLDDQYRALPDEFRQMYTREEILEQLIDKELLLQYAYREGIRVTQQETEERIDELVASFGISRQQLEQVLVNGGSSLQEYRSAVQEEMVLMRLLETIVSQRIPVSDEEVLSFYIEMNIEVPFGEIRESIRDTLAQQRAPEYLSALIEELREDATISVFI